MFQLSVVPPELYTIDYFKFLAKSIAYPDDHCEYLGDSFYSYLQLSDTLSKSLEGFFEKSGRILPILQTRFCLCNC